MVFSTLEKLAYRWLPSDVVDLLKLYKYQFLFGGVFSFLFGRKVFDILKRKFFRLPPGPGIGLPYFGSFLSYYKDEYKFLHELGLQYNGVSMIYLNNRRTIFINDFNLLSRFFNRKELTNSANAEYSKNDSSRQFMLLNGDKWKKRRQLFHLNLVRQLKSTKLTLLMRNYFDNHISPIIDNHINKGNIWYIHKETNWMSFSSLYASIFGTTLDPNDSGFLTYLNANSTAFKDFKFLSVMPFLPLWLLLLSPRLYALMKAWKSSKDVTTKWVENYNNNKNNNDSDSKNNEETYMDALQNVLEIQTNTNEWLNKEGVENDIFAAIAGGMHSTALQIEQCIVYLAKCGNELQDIIYNEIISNCNINDKSFDILQNKKNLHIFNAFIYESLRMNPSTKSQPRILEKDIQIEYNNQIYILPKNSRVCANLYYISNDKNFWENEKNTSNVFEFDYKRFLNSNNEFDSSLSLRGSLLFSYGRRDCPGRQLAMKEIYLILGMLIIKYRFAKPTNIADKDYQIKTNYFSLEPPRLGVTVTKR